MAARLFSRFYPLACFCPPLKTDVCFSVGQLYPIFPRFRCFVNPPGVKCVCSCAARCLFCAAARHLAFLRGVPQAAPGCGVSAPARRVPFRMHEKGPKVHIRGYPPYGTPGRVPAFGWAEKTRMSQPAPTCFLPRQAPPTRPGLCRKTPLHSARSGRASQLAGEGHTGRGR